MGWRGVRYFWVVETGGHDNGLDMKDKRKGRTHGCCWKSPVLDGLKRNRFLSFFVLF